VNKRVCSFMTLSSESQLDINSHREQNGENRYEITLKLEVHVFFQSTYSQNGMSDLSV
jgi:hypothetical protein